MKNLIIFDDNGKVFYNVSDLEENLNLPNGLQHIVFDMPVGKMLKDQEFQIDLSGDEPVPVLQDIPKNDIQKLREELELTQEVVNFLLSGME